MRLTARTLGFAIPTVALVTTLHLNRDSSAGEAVDGVLSGLAFTLPYMAISWLRLRVEGDRASNRTRSHRMELLFGISAAVVAWAALWVGWTLPAMQSQRPNAFWWNCAVMALAALLLPAVGRERREYPDHEPFETTAFMR